MATRWTHALDDQAIRSVVTAGTYARGADYAAHGRVVTVSGRGGDALLGQVTGSGRRDYQTLVTFGDDARPWTGRCSCPVGLDCKHAVAVLLAARPRADPGGGSSRRSAGEEHLARLAAAVSDRHEPAPHQTLVLQARLVAGRPGRYGDASSGEADQRLALRPLALGDNGRYVAAGASWRELQYASPYAARRVSAAHREALLALPNLADARQRASYGYRSTDAPVHADEVGPALWSLLAQVEDAGVELVTGEPSGGRRLTVDASRPVVLLRSPTSPLLDVRREGPDGADARGGRTWFEPVLDLGGHHVPAGTATLLGSPAHGFALDRSTAAPVVEGRPVPPDALVLGPLDKPVGDALGSLVRTGRFDVPTAEVPQLLQRYVRAVRQVVTLVSSDRSTEIPEIAPPRLHLRLDHEPDHRLVLGAGIAYPVGDGHEVVPIGRDDTGTVTRDLVAETTLLADLLRSGNLPEPLPQLLAMTRRSPDARTVLVGLDTARFVVDALPALRDRDDLVLSENGTPLPYRDEPATPRISVSTTATEDGRTDWFDLTVDVDVDGEPVPLELLLPALVRDDSHVLLPSGAVVGIRRRELQQLRELLAEARAMQDSERGPLRLSLFQADLWQELVELGVVQQQAEQWRATVAALTGPPAAPPPVPAGLLAELRPYQQAGYEWLCRLTDLGLGGVLADDMGLGKTVQALALVCHRLETDPSARPFLVVAPTSVVPVWAQEAARFAPGLRVRTIDATSAKAGYVLEDVAADADVVVTSYTLLRLEAEAYEAVTWEGLLLDEAQHVKNRNARTHQCVRRLRARVRVAITGTPMENDLMELWALLSIVAPGLFPHPVRFREHFAQPISSGTAPERLTTLRRRIRPLLLRRTKEQVARDLPDKLEQVVHVQLEPRHRKAYDRRLAREQQKVLRLIDDPQRNRFEILRSLTLLRRLSLDAALVDPAHEGIGSAKVETLLERLRVLVAEGHRALVFSQFTSFLTRVRSRLEAEGIEHAYLDGRTRDRARRVEQWRTGDAPVFLISLKAGGSGLTLTEADYVFVLDPWWNPAVEAQAVDRTHRIGQTRAVMVYRLVSAGTIEEKVMALKARKLELVSSVLAGEGGSGGDGETGAARLDADDLRELMGL